MSEIIAKRNTFHSPICNGCENHIKGLKCKAFEVIPDSILTGDNDHSKPLPDQGNNIVFEPKKESK